MLQSLGQLHAAIDVHVEAIARAQSHGFVRQEAMQRLLHARATQRLGNVFEAVSLHEQALILHEQVGDRRLAAAERGHLGYCLDELGAVTRAEPVLRAAVTGLLQVGDRVLACIDRMLLVRTLVQSKRFVSARLELALCEEAVVGLNLPRILLTRDLVAGFLELEQFHWQASREWFHAAIARGPLLEVGFEALAPAWLAFVEAVLGNHAAAGDACVLAEQALRGLEAPGLRRTAEALMAFVEGAPIVDAPPELRATSSDLRRAADMLSAVAKTPRLRVSQDAQHVLLPQGRAVDLVRRGAPRRVFAVLVRARCEAPGRVVSRDTLIESGWPGERMHPEAADKRLRTAIWTLRKEGLAPVLLTRDDGYLLDPLCAIERGS